MRGYFTRERFGRPQFLAGLLLLAFLAQVLWLVHAELRAANGPDGLEAVRIREGWKQWHGGGIAGAPLADVATNIGFSGNDAPAMQPEMVPGRDKDGFDTEHSPLLYLASAAPLLILPQRGLESAAAGYWEWLPRLPFLACGVFLGASLWYVARRLCGNTGGYVALTFYCFSPAMIQASSVWHTEPEIVAAWGAFVARLHRAGRLQAGCRANWTRMSGPVVGTPGGDCNLCGVAAHTLLRQYRAPPAGGAVRHSGHGASA